MLAKGARLGPYEITGSLGAGGMGVVYRARDTRLGRDVAIKVLPEQLAADPDRVYRFEQEARAVAALNHPNICQIYDVGPGYLVLEYIDGAPLSGPLPAEAATRLALQMAVALDTAHRRGILHRDLKPANVLVTADGRVKLLDFGLAKTLAPAESDLTRTIAGTIAGTAAYMSPEQAQGLSVDVRSDVFNFGSVLYELLSGARAFDGASAAQILSAVLRDDPRPLEPSAVARVVYRCLEKEPSRRYQTMAEVRDALEQLSAKPAATVSSIAVLPFANMSADKENEYFSDGLSEEIINTLAHVPELKVTARTSAFAFRGKEQDIRTIAKALDVRTVLEGSVRRFGSRLRVTAQLIDAADGYHLWSERYDRELSDVFAIQDEIAQAIAAALRVTLTKGKAPRRPTANLDAYEAYLKARYYQWKLLPEFAARSKAYYEEALALDPHLAAAHVGLAHYWFALAAFSAMPTHDAMPRVREGALNALRIDPSLPEAHALLGVVAGIYDYDWKEAARRFDLALGHEPVPAEVRTWYGAFYLVPQGRHGEAIEQHRAALRTDPLNITFLNGLAEAYGAADQWDLFEASARQMIDVDPVYYVGHFFLAMSMLVQKRWSEAFELLQHGQARAGFGSASFLELFELVAAHGGFRDRLKDLPALEGRPLPRWGVAPFYLLCGDDDRAADAMESALDGRHMMVGRFLGWKRWKSNPRWPELARKINVPE
jgi:TolB-like protein/predicted Ser/Thr protein kinase